MTSGLGLVFDLEEGEDEEGEGVDDEEEDDEGEGVDDGEFEEEVEGEVEEEGLWDRLDEGSCNPVRPWEFMT